MKSHYSLIAATLLACAVLVSACGGSQSGINPLQSALPTATLPPAATLPVAGTQTPIVIATATLGAAPPVAPATAPVAQPAQPTQKPGPTEVLPPSATPPPTLTPDLTEVFGPAKTPNTKATTFAVIQTITALAASPTYPPTSTPRPRRQPVIIGAGPKGQTNSAAQRTGVRLQTVSPQVSPGGPAALSIQTTPNTLCALQIARATDGGLIYEPVAGSARQSAGRDGGVAWIWTVDSDEPAGPMTMVVDCGAAGSHQYAIEVIR